MWRKDWIKNKRVGWYFKSYDENKDIINGIKLEIEKMSDTSSNNIDDNKIKNINKLINIINENLKKNNEKLKNLFNAKKID